MRKHKIPALYVNGRFLAQRQTGVQRFAREIVKTLDALMSEPEHADLQGRVTLITPAEIEAPAGLVNMRHVSSGWLGHGYAWEQFDLLRLSAGGVLLNLCNLGPLAKRRQVVVVHDATPRAVPQAFSLPFRIANDILIPSIARRAAQIATVSEFSRGELSHWFGIPASRMAVCHEGGEHIVAEPADRSVLVENGLVGQKYFLGVGLGPANKNLSLLLTAFSQANLGAVRLVLTGRRSPRVHGAATVEFPPGVVHVGHVTDAELRALYEGALALVYPSSYEGFGLPPLEAMVCGCPVIISDQLALLEVAGDAAKVVKKNDVAGFSAALTDVAEDPSLRTSLSTRGPRRAAMFTWRATTLRLLEQCKAAAGQVN